jgi:hypothetical protein
MLQQEQFFERDLENGASSAARVFHLRFSLENVFNRKDDREEVASKYSGAVKGTIL